MLADIHKLVNSAHTPNNGPVPDGHMAGYLRIIAHNAIIPHNTIMGEVAISHDKAIFTYDRLISCFCPPVYSNEFTDSRAVTDKYIGIFALELQVLRNSCYHRSREYPAVFSYPGSFHDCDIGPYPGTISDLYILVDNREGVHFYIGSQFRIRVNICMGMNHVVFYKKATFLNVTVQR